MCALIFTLSSLGGASVSSNLGVDWVSHKTTHLFLYFILSMTFYRGSKNILVAVLLTSIYGISDEIHQLFVPTRSGNFFDILVDSAGGLFAGLVLWKLYAKMPEKLKLWLEE